MENWNTRLLKALSESEYRDNSAAFARAVKVSAPTVSDWKKGNIKKLSAESADKICRALNINSHWLLSGKGPMRGKAEGGNVVHIKRKEDNPDMIEIPRLSVNGSMGGGLAAPAGEQIAEYLSLRRQFIADHLSVSNPSNLRLITGYGDSMKETIADGDILLVDTGITEIRMDAVFVLARDSESGWELFVKRIQRLLDGSFMVISDNKAYEPYKLEKADLADIRVCGRVAWVWNGQKL